MVHKMVDGKLMMKCDNCRRYKMVADRIHKGKGEVIIYYCLYCGHIRRAIVSCDCNSCKKRANDILGDLREG